MTYLIGASFIAVGIVVILLGDRTVQSPDKDGVGRRARMKYLVGAVIIGVGIWLLTLGAD